MDAYRNGVNNNVHNKEAANDVYCDAIDSHACQGCFNDV
jgi:hypothetical protein